MHRRWAIVLAAIVVAGVAVTAALAASSRSSAGKTFYFIPKDAASGKAFPKTAGCFACHADHGAVDTTFVQYYPSLIGAAKNHGTYKYPKLSSSAARQ